MKNLTEFLIESTVNEAKQLPGLANHKFNDIAEMIYNEGDNNDVNWSKELRHNDVYDLLEYWAAFSDLAKELSVDVDALQDWVIENDKELKKFLKKY